MDSDGTNESSQNKIKVKDFAKITAANPSSSKTGNPSTSKKKRVKVKNSGSSKKKRTKVKHSGSSDEEDVPKTPAKRAKRQSTTTTPATNGAKRSTVKKSTKVKDITEPPRNNALISQFFKPVSQPSTEKKPKLEPMKSDKENELVKKGPDRTVTEKSVPTVVMSKARRRLCPGTNLKLVSNRYHDDDQSRMSEFYDKTKEADFNYYTTAENSKLPTIIDGELDVESCLGICLTEESRVLEFNDSQVDKPIEEVQKDIVKLIDRIQNPVRDESDDERERWNMEMAVEPVVQESSIPDTTPRKKKGPRTKKTVICPKYKIISGTTFAVDAFRFGYIDGISHYFLTHFHSDHYIGLKKDFNRPLILSTVTAACVQKFIKVDSQYMLLLDPNQTMTINNIKITAIDANHCPGAVMFAFEFPDGQITLHVGDFRATPEMESHPIFWNHDINELYLDTTYLTSKYSLCSQNDCIKRAIQETESYYEKHVLDKVLIVVGAYVIGKEKVWTALAERFNLRVWADKNRRDALEAINNQDMMKFLVNDPRQAQLHVINMGFVNYDDLKNYLEQFEHTFTHILAFRPSGWEKKSKARHQGKVSVVGLEYSEHSSYDELRRFVGFLRPKTIISTVPMGKDPNKTPTIPQEWYQGELKPIREGTQPKIYDFVGPKESNSVTNSRSSTPNCTQLNPSAIKRREEAKQKVSAIQVTETIDLDSD